MWSRTSSPTSGTATTSRSSSGRTSGSTRAGRPTPSGSGREHEGFFTPQDAFDFFYSEIPDDDPFWEFVIGQPPQDDLFGNPVYIRGGMTLQVLRNRVGDADFFEIARSWVQEQGGGTGTTAQFIALAERVSGQQLDDLFDAWLFTGSKPTVTSLAARAAVAPQGVPQRVDAVRTWDAQFTKRLSAGRY